MIRFKYSFRGLYSQLCMVCLSTAMFFESIKPSGPIGRYYMLYLQRFRKHSYFKCVMVIFVLFIFLRLIWPAGKSALDDKDYFPFEPDLDRDFPSGKEGQLKIPKIIHWTYRDTRLLPAFHENVKSFVRNNPEWTFYFWTDEGSRRFIADRQPELLSTYDSYKGFKENIKRADFVRYVVLYEIGGIYVDLDVFDFRPLDRLLSKYTCIFPPEPFEHAILRASTPYLINNAIMICQPKHPFLKFLLDNLPRFQNIVRVNDATGPGFVTTVFKLYNSIGYDEIKYDPDISRDKADNSPYFYKGRRSIDDPDSVYIPNTQYFASQVDPKGRFDYLVCNNIDQLDDLRKRACTSLAKRRLSPKNYHPYLFLEHQFYTSYEWYHVYVHWSLYLRLFAVDIRDLVPNVRIYELGH